MNNGGVHKRPFVGHLIVSEKTLSMAMPPVTYSYARVSEADDGSKNIDTQIRLLADYGIRPELVFSNVASGRTLKRPVWQDLISRLRPGYTLTVAFLDRLSRILRTG